MEKNQKRVVITVSIDKDAWTEWKLICVRKGWKIRESVEELVRMGLEMQKGGEQA